MTQWMRDDSEDSADAAAPATTRAEAAVNRILSRDARALALGADEGRGHTSFDGDQLDLEERNALRRVVGLSTERQDISDVEYRQLRLEKVILIGLFGERSLQDAEYSLRELAALAETAGATVLDLPALVIGPPDSWGPLDDALAELEEFHWLVVSSANGVDAVEQRLRRLGSGLAQRPRGLKIAAVGRKTAARLEALGAPAERMRTWRPEEATAAAQDVEAVTAAVAAALAAMVAAVACPQVWAPSRAASRSAA